MLIKVCGLRDPENIRAVIGLGVDFIGFVFQPDDPRFVQMISSRAGIIPDYSEERLHRIKDNATQGEEGRNAGVRRVGVFADDMPQSIVTRVYNYSLDYVQLNGQELPVMIDNLRRTLSPDIRPGIKIIKTLRICQPEDFTACKDYQGYADMFLFDIQPSSDNLNVVPHDWSILYAYDGDIPFLLGGTIGLDDADSLQTIKHPMFAGVDLDTCFEIQPAVKDTEMLTQFINAVR